MTREQLEAMAKTLIPESLFDADLIRHDVVNAIIAAHDAAIEASKQKALPYYPRTALAAEIADAIDTLKLGGKP